MNADQIVYLLGIVSTGAVFYTTGYWTGKNVWRKTGYDEGYLEALRRISTRNPNNFQTKLRKAERSARNNTSTKGTK